MTDIHQPLVDILRVLERIDERLQKQDKRFEHLENLATARNEAGNTQRPGNTSTLMPDEQSRGEDLNHTHSRREHDGHVLKRSPSGNLLTLDISSGHDSMVPKVPYGEWSINQAQGNFDEDFMKMLEKHLGDYCLVPKDNRLPLELCKSVGIRNYWELHVTTSSTIRPTGQRLDKLRHFDAQLRKRQGNDFLVVDFDSTNSTRLYRIGEKAIGSELMVDPGHVSYAPWSRLILYQGMTTGDSINPNMNRFDESLPEPIPYFRRGETGTGLWTHIFSHLRLKHRNITTNPYLDNRVGFHTTFYEVRERRHLGAHELWKQGPLYDHPLGWYFRKSSYTLYVPTSADMLTGDIIDLGSLTRHWTILLLAPDLFFDENNTSFPMADLPPGAEMNLIGQGLERISERWAAFQSFFDFILDGGDSLMKPREHDNLLFDDGAFSRSRRYFWAIDCLSEFEASISDNINQWELYKTARISPLFSSKALPELDILQFRHAERQYHVLQNQREYFRQKLVSTKALRDALFNASAVIESRASTRLGENVKLLTFVSIFFLPLAFCTSLWSINDKFSSTALIIVIIIVALLTYITTFNVNSFVSTFSRLYAAKKRALVTIMKSDRDPAWQQRAHRFEVFRPKLENPEPSQWYVSLYALRNPAALLGLRRGDAGRDGDKPESESRIGVWRYLGLAGWGKAKAKAKAKEQAVEDDQPWVL